MQQLKDLLRDAFCSFFGNRMVRWILVVSLTWGIPATVFWAGLHMFVADRITRNTSLTSEEIESGLDNHVYDSLPARFFHPRFSGLFKQLKGLPSNKEGLEKILTGFDRQWRPGLIEVFLFNGEGKVIPIRGAKPEHELFFTLANSDYESGPIAPEQLSSVGRLFPAPDLILGRIRDQRDKVIELGNPDRYSLCYFDFDRSIKNRFVAGILVFVHFRHLQKSDILASTVTARNPVNYGYIGYDSIKLPQILEGMDAESLKAYYEQYPTSTFSLAGKLIGIKRLDEYTLLLGAYELPQAPVTFLFLLFLLFVAVSILFLRLSYRVMVLQIRYQHNVRQRLAGLFALSYALPLIAAGFLSFQYLRELRHSLVLEEKHSNYRRLSEIDAGFTRFITSKLLEFRSFTQELRGQVSSPEELINRLEQQYTDFIADNIHMVSSEAVVIYSTDLLSAEVRRHFNKTRAEQQKILESWKLRHASITSQHIRALFEGSPNTRSEEPEKSDGHKGFIKLFASTALAAMDFYNNSQGITLPLKRSSTNLVVDAIIESNTHTLFQSARTNISRFTNLQGLDEIYLGYLDVLPGPAGEAWYAFTMLVDLANFERQYFERLFGDLRARSEIMNRVFPEEDIRAVSMHQYAANFPSVLEFKNFESVIRRSESDFKTFTHKMEIDGRESYVSVLRGSYLKHYLLIRVSPLDKLEQMFRKRVSIVIIIFSVILVMGLALARLLTRLLILPISDIMVGVKALAERNYQHRIPVRSANEFGVLAQAFNESAEILKNLTISEKIRRQLYPDLEFRCGSYLISTANSNSRIILSDFFDFIPLKQGTYAIILAEVSGNDISAAYLTAMLKTSFTLLCPSFPFSPELILEKLNQIFLPYYQKGHMTTCLIGIIDPTNDVMICANAGQSYPISIAEKTGEKMFVSLPSAPLGISPETKFRKHEISLDKRMVLLYSDGAVNLLDRNGERLGHEAFLEIVQQSLKSDHRNPSDEILRKLNAVSMHLPWRDDITIMCIQNRI